MATCTPNQTVIEDNGSSETISDGKLFWALRGGGGGTFGVVVHYVLKLHLAQSAYVSGSLMGSLYLNESDRPILKESLEMFEEWTRSAPTYWGGVLIVYSRSLFVFISKLGPWDNNTESELRPLFDFKSLYHQQVSINIANLTSSADIVVSDGSTSLRSYTTGALIHNTTGLWDFLIQALMDHHAGNVSVYYSVSRLGGKHKEN